MNMNTIKKYVWRYIAFAGTALCLAQHTPMLASENQSWFSTVTETVTNTLGDLPGQLSSASMPQLLLGIGAAFLPSKPLLGLLVGACGFGLNGMTNFEEFKKAAFKKEVQDDEEINDEEEDNNKEPKTTWKNFNAKNAFDYLKTSGNFKTSVGAPVATGLLIGLLGSFIF
ncbi:TPA: hypothetical protein DCW54_01815 [Candidatus Dependentiae bacterium]|nr:hypothetical protein [Candidatus Dependentiae bacterium]